MINPCSLETLRRERFIFSMRT